MFAITQELFPIYKPAIGSWPFVLPTMTRQERRLVMENSFRPVFFFFFYDFNKDINILIFHRRIKLVKHTSSEALQPFKWRRITKVAASRV